MSQHIHETVYNSRPINILTGWDRPLQGHFLVVEFTDQPDEYLYDNLSDPDLAWCMGLPPTMDHFIEKLASLNISLPSEMLANVLVDKFGSAGNKVVFY